MSSQKDEDEQISEGYESPTKTSSFKKRLLKRDGHRFNKYIQSTTTHGVVYIFVGKSKIRRIFWLLIVLAAAAGCLYNVINRVVFLASGPTSTTISIIESDRADFPAVTLCNLNLVKKGYLDNISTDLSFLIREAFYIQGTASKCRSTLEEYQVNFPSNLSLSDLIWNGRQTAEETIFGCRFMGQECKSYDFVPSLTPSGVCYTFDSRGMAVQGTGAKHALSFIVSILEGEYSVSYNHDVGIKIAVQPQNEPPQPDELGIAVSPGKNAFIGVRQTNIENKSSRRKCRDTTDTTSFNFLQGKFPYSVSACQIDCMRTNIAQNCKCLGAGANSLTSKFHNLQNCTIKELCCVVAELNNASQCDCPEACRKTMYTTGTSYSGYPADYAAQDVIDEATDAFNISNDTFIDTNIIQKNILAVNIYFETLTVEEQVTTNAYDIVALLSDIGGQLGLFLGASVISIFEFLTWVFDETKDRCCGMSERKIVNKLKSLTDVKRCKQKRHGRKNRVNVINTGGDGTTGKEYRNFEEL